jgi:four helix bundle protein
MEGGLQELDETAYWLEILLYSKLRDQADVRELASETEELISIFVSSVKTAKKRN